MRAVQATLRSLGRPAKVSLTVAATGLGVAALIFALSTSAAVTRLASERLDGNGLVVAVAVTDRSPGGTLGANGDRLRRQVTAALLSDVVGVAAVSSAADVPFRSFAVGGRFYEIRRVLSVSAT